VGLVDDQERAGVPRGGSQSVVETGLRVNDADVRQHRLGQHAGDVAVGQLAPKRLDVVPLDQARRLGETGGPRFPARATTAPSSSVAKVSSTVPW
jgi:hypothetical protein